MQKQNDFLTRELRKASGSPPSTPPLPRASTPPLSARAGASTSSKFHRNLRLDFEWKMAHRHCSALVVTCAVYASDGRFLREISAPGVSAEFPAVQLTPAHTYGDSGSMRMDLVLDKIGNTDLVFFVAKKSDGSSFYDVLNFKCSLIGFGILKQKSLLFLSFFFLFLFIDRTADNKEMAQFPTVNPSGDHQSLVIGSTTYNSALSGTHHPYRSLSLSLSLFSYSPPLPSPPLFPSSLPTYLIV